jgi:signal transduction histidine kinase
VLWNRIPPAGPAIDSKHTLRNLKRQSYVEWLALALMVMVSAVLATIQYNWTGRLSRAESERLRLNVREQLRQINRAWTAELMESWRALRPSAGETARVGRQAYAARYRQWLAHDHPPLYSRVGLDTGVGDSQRLLAIDPASGGFVPWQPAGDASAQFEVPGAPSPTEGTAAPQEWIVFELNQDYLRRTVLPELIRTWLSGADGDFRVRVRTLGSSAHVIYESSPGSAEKNGDPLASAEFSARGSRRVRDGEGEHHWVIEAWNRSGSLEAAVSAARWRNFGVACVLIALIPAAGFALLRYTSRSRRLAEMQLRFVAGVSHEMRTPLAVIRGAGQNMATGVVRDHEQMERYAGMIVKHADQLGETIEQVLMFAAAQKQETHAASTVSVAGALDEAVEASSIDLQESGCELRLRIDPGLPQVLGDPAALRRAFQNLITNAARHGRAGGWISISADALDVDDRHMAEVRVADGGPGIPDSELSRIFEPFYRGERARSEQIRGAGLGLSLLHEIAEAHGGSVAVRSGPGCGTVFSIRLPGIIRRSDASSNSGY